MQCRDGADGSAGVLPARCIGGEVVEGGGAAVAFVCESVSPGIEVSTDDCGPGGERDDYGQSCGGGGAVSAEGGDVVMGKVARMCLEQRLMPCNMFSYF